MLRLYKVLRHSSTTMPTPNDAATTITQTP